MQGNKKKMNSEAQKMGHESWGGGFERFFSEFVAPKIEKDEPIFDSCFFNLGGNHQAEVKYTLQKSLLLLKIQRTQYRKIDMSFTMGLWVITLH